MRSSELPSGIGSREVIVKKRTIEERKTIEGGQRATKFVREAVATGKVNGNRLEFDANFIKAIHKRVCFSQDWAGKLREGNVGVGGEIALDWPKLSHNFYLLGRWLEAQRKRMSQEPDNILLALETAAAAHYGLTRPELHPFPEGNGRTARALVNAILMYSTDELRFHTIALPPVPLLRSYNEKEDQRYMRSLRNVRETDSLNPLMSFIARRWSANLSDLLGEIDNRIKKPYEPSDLRQIETLRRRRARLDEFTGEAGNNVKNNDRRYTLYPIPNYSDSRWLHE